MFSRKNRRHIFASPLHAQERCWFFIFPKRRFVVSSFSNGKENSPLIPAELCRISDEAAGLHFSLAGGQFLKQSATEPAGV